MIKKVLITLFLLVSSTVYADERIVRIVNSTGGISTGFYIQENVIIGCAHAMEPNEEVQINPQILSDHLTGTVIQHNMSADYAFVKVPGKHRFFKFGKPKIGALVRSGGFPGGVTGIVWRENARLVERGSSVDGLHKFFVLRMPTFPGQSGSPVLLNDEVIGMVHAQFDENASACCVDLESTPIGVHGFASNSGQ